MSARPQKAAVLLRCAHSRFGPIAYINTKEPPPIREAAFASLKAPLRPVRAPVDPTDASEGREASGRRRPCTIVVKPSLARVEARDYRVTRSRVMFRCML